jgi:TetR/AcrR family fatty acid metabolism transcriptional regulator
MAIRGGEKYATILDAAQVVFADRGYHGAQISKVAAEAGVAAGTVYLYFKNKPDLLVSLFRDRLGMLIEQARCSIGHETDARAKLHCFVNGHLRSLARDQGLAMVTQIELRQADISVQKEINTIMTGYFDVIDEIIAEGQESGLFRIDVPGKQMRNMVFGTLDQTVTAWVMSGCRFDLEALVEPTVQLVTSGCVTIEKGENVLGDSGSTQTNV